MAVTPKTELAAELVDIGIRFIRLLGTVPEGSQRDTVRRAGQTMRLVSQLVGNGTYSLEVGQAWRDAGDITLRRIEDARTH